MTVGLAGCGNATGHSHSSDKDPSAHAQLDFATGEIIMPLTAYNTLATWQDQATIEHAEQISIGQCMTREGFAYAAAQAVETADTSIGDRQYGLWDEAQARKFGYDPEPSAVQVAIDTDKKAGGTPWSDGLSYCQDHEAGAVKKLRPSNKEVTTSIVARLQTQAYNEASADPAWQKAREKWWSCLKTAGLDPRTGANDWSSKQAYEILTQVNAAGKITDQEGEIRVAYTEAHCNVQTGLAQTLGNLEAAYQAPLIAKNQAAINVYQTLKQKRLAEARNYIAANG